MTIGERLKIIKNYYRFKHDEFAEILGISTQMITKYFRGDNIPSLTSIYKLIERIPDLDINWLLFGRGEMLIVKGANNQINSYKKNNTIDQIAYYTEEAVNSVGPNNALYEVTISKFENEIKQLKALVEAKDKTIDSLEDNIGTLKDNIDTLKDMNNLLKKEG